ncbi:MAG: hypothetical protein ABRQ33_06450 [Smithellaceae bacterium]
MNINFTYLISADLKQSIFGVHISVRFLSCFQRQMENGKINNK